MGDGDSDRLHVRIGELENYIARRNFPEMTDSRAGRRAGGAVAVATLQGLMPTLFSGFVVRHVSYPGFLTIRSERILRGPKRQSATRGVALPSGSHRRGGPLLSRFSPPCYGSRNG